MPANNDLASPSTITYATCQEWARAIIAVRGQPPFTQEQLDEGLSGTDEELRAHDAACLALINDFCTHWQDKL